MAIPVKHDPLATLTMLSCVSDRDESLARTASSLYAMVQGRMLKQLKKVAELVVGCGIPKVGCRTYAGCPPQSPMAWVFECLAGSE